MVRNFVILSLPPFLPRNYTVIKDFQLDLWQLLLFMKKYGSPALQPHYRRIGNIKAFSAEVYGQKIVKASWARNTNAAEIAADSHKIHFALVIVA